MKNTVFTGAGTAVITPMTETGVDYEALGRLIDFQVEKGIDGHLRPGAPRRSPSSRRDRSHTLRYEPDT